MGSRLLLKDLSLKIVGVMINGALSGCVKCVMCVRGVRRGGDLVQSYMKSQSREMSGGAGMGGINFTYHIFFPGSL